MFNGSQSFVRFSSGARHWAGLSWWLALAPGVALILLALAIVVWPELLAYLVAGSLLFAGITLTAWGLALRRAARARVRQENVVYYEVS